MEDRFSTQDITDVLGLLNAFLKHISIVLLSRTEAELADPEKRLPGTDNSRYSHIVKVVNRWGIKDEGGKYNRFLNDVIGKITSRHPMLLIYKPMELLLFNKLLEGWRGGRTEFTREEIERFFLQPYRMITCSCIPESAVHLYVLITKSRNLSVVLKSKDSKDFMNEGVGRRLFMLKATVDSVSRIYTQHRREALDDNERAILSQNTNFFYANVYAILDCLAFVLAFEHPDYEIERSDKPKFRNVGLFREDFYRNMNGLAEKLSLANLKPWYDEIAGLRHPVAHRIPLYFPEFYNDEDASRIKEADEKYFRESNDIFRSVTSFTDEENAQLDGLREEWQTTSNNVNAFSGCFLDSYEDSKKLYHLSRLTLDMGILYYLLDRSFEYLFALCKSVT